METTRCGVVHFFPGGTQTQYEASIAAVHPGEGLLPAGQVFHAVHDSKESWEEFRDQILLPRMQEGIVGGFASPPTETVIDVYQLIK
jgi:hypothetical protein